MCKVKAKIRGKIKVLQTIGYRGKKEAKTPLADLRQARCFIAPKNQAKGLKVGKKVTVTVGKKKIKCTVKKWSRGSKLLIPHENYPLKSLSTKTLKKVIVS